MEYLKYSEYRQPEIHSPYLIPTHWKEVKFRFLFTFGRGLGITKSDLVDEGIACINYGEIHSKYGFEIVPEKQDLKCVVESYLENSISSLLNNGDFVFADTSEDLEGSGNFAHLNSNVPTFAGYHTVIARPTGEHLSRFLAYFIDSSLYRSQIRKNVSGVKVFSITQAILKNSYIWLPPIDEQEKIAVFLDNKTQKIDSLIKKKKELIEKLEEQRIAVITQAVTKGIDENAKLKPSGVDWLGDVPEHWEVKRLKFVGDAIMGLIYDPKDLVNEGEGHLVLRASNIQGGGMVNKDNVYVNMPILDKLVTQRDDILICSRNGSRALIGKNALIGEEYEGSSFGAFTTVFRSDINDFLYFVFNSNLFSCQAGKYLTSTINQLTIGVINSFEVPIPDEAERQDIVIFLREKLDKLDSSKQSTLNLIVKLEEYRSAIITSAVTGKIDVREIELPKVKA